MTKVNAQTFAKGFKKGIHLGKTFYKFLVFINREYFKLILKMKMILINCTGKFCSEIDKSSTEICKMQKQPPVVLLKMSQNS